MRPHFAIGSSVPARESLILRGGGKHQLDLAVRYGLVIHPTIGPVLIDTGYTPHAATGRKRGFALRAYWRLLGARLVDSGQPEPFLASFGLTPDDIRHVIVSHFHADHVSGLAQFPHARFIACDHAWNRIRHRSAIGNLRHGVFPELIPADFGNRLIGLSSLPHTGPSGGLPGGADLFGDGSIIAIDLPGHADGHFGILFPAADQPLLYAVDAQWLRAALIEDRAPGYPARLIAEDHAALNTTSTLLRRFVEGGGDLVLCHDPAPTAHDHLPDLRT